MKCPVCDGELKGPRSSGDLTHECSACNLLTSDAAWSLPTSIMDIDRRIGDILRAREAHQAKQKEPRHDPH